MSERDSLKAELFEAQEAAKKAASRAEVLCGHIREWLNPLLHAPIEMRVADAAALMDELVMVQAELLRQNSRIDALQKALYD